MIMTSDEGIERINELISKYEDFINPKEKCPNCQGKGMKSIYNGRIFISDIICQFCNHLGKINPLKTFPEEKSEHINRRLIKNFIDENNYSIKKDFIHVISLFNEGITKVPKELAENFSPERFRYLNYSTSSFIELLWNKSKSKNIETLIQIYIKYFLRSPTSPQLRSVKQVTGISKDWYRLSMDYYQCYKIIGDVEKELTENEKKIKKYSKLDEAEKRELLDEPRQPFNTTSREDILRIKFIQQLAWCVEHDPTKYSFSEKEISSLNRDSKMILFLELKKKESKNVKKFLENWIRSLENQIADIIEMDKSMFEELFSKIKVENDPMNLINQLYDENKKQFRQNEDEDGLIYDYKASIFARQDKIENKRNQIKNKLKQKLSNSELDKKSKEFADREAVDKILKTICAFLMTGTGVILIGVKDDGSIIGVEAYRETFISRYGKNITSEKFPDVYRLHIQDILQEHRQKDIRNNFLNSNIKVNLISKNKQSIIAIHIKKSNELCWFTFYDEYIPQKTRDGLIERKNGQNIELNGKALSEKILEYKRD